MLILIRIRFRTPIQSTNKNNTFSISSRQKKTVKVEGFSPCIIENKPEKK